MLHALLLSVFRAYRKKCIKINSAQFLTFAQIALAKNCDESISFPFGRRSWRL
jgi:hypothetical protein